MTEQTRDSQRPRRVALVSCGAQKRRGEHPARELYTSTVFQLSAAYAERCFDRWYIVSAMYGLISPDRVITDYDYSLEQMGKASRWCWARGVAGTLKRHNDGAEITLLAGGPYRDALAEWLEFEDPLKGMGIGQRQGWLRDQLDAACQAVAADTGSYGPGDRVLIERRGAEPAVAEVVGEEPHRPHVVKVIYAHSGTSARVARRRILGPAPAKDAES